MKGITQNRDDDPESATDLIKGKVTHLHSADVHNKTNRDMKRYQHYYKV